MSDTPRIAFLAHGELFVLDGGAPRKIESKFADQYRARVRSLQRRQAWKEEGAGARFMRGGGAALWGDDAALESIPVAYTGVARRGPSTLLYTISTGVVGGLLELDLESGEEKRIFHSADKRIEQIATSRDHDVIACTVRSKGGLSAVAVMAGDGSELMPVTDGDVIDLAPSWLPEAAIREGRRHQLVYQSAGIGRDSAGVFVAIGPASIALLDAEAGDMQVLFESPQRDFLMPRMDARRTLYAVRRPYADVTRPSPTKAALDLLLFPLRLGMAVIAYLSFFTLRYTGRPLFTSGDARQRSADIRQMMMTGNLASARESASREAEKAAVDAVRDWELVTIAEDKTERVLARGVRAYDVLGDGRCVVTDGARIQLIDSDGNAALLHEERSITEVVALD